MSLEENKAIVRRVFEELRNNRKLELADELYAPDIIEHQTSDEIEFRGLEAKKRQRRTERTDSHYTILDMIAEEDRVAVRIRVRFRHTGEWLGISPTGKELTAHAVDIFRIAGGKIVEKWWTGDAGWGQLFEELGVVVRRRQDSG